MFRYLICIQCVFLYSYYWWFIPRSNLFNLRFFSSSWVLTRSVVGLLTHSYPLRFSRLFLSVGCASQIRTLLLDAEPHSMIGTFDVAQTCAPWGQSPVQTIQDTWALFLIFCTRCHLTVTSTAWKEPRLNEWRINRWLTRQVHSRIVKFRLAFCMGFFHASLTTANDVQIHLRWVQRSLEATEKITTLSRRK